MAVGSPVCKMCSDEQKVSKLRHVKCKATKPKDLGNDSQPIHPYQSEMETPDSDPPIVVYCRQQEQYERELESYELAVADVENKMAMVSADIDAYRLRTAYKKELSRQRVEQSSMFLEDDWEFRNESWAEDFARRNPIAELPPYNPTVFHAALHLSIALNNERCALIKPSWTEMVLPSLKELLNAPQQTRVRPPSTPIQTVLEPRVLFTDDGSAILPPNKLQRVGDAAVVPMNANDVLQLSSEQRAGLSAAMAAREDEEDSALGWYRYYDDDMPTGDDSGSNSIATEIDQTDQQEL